MDSGIAEYYLVLLQLHLAVLGVVIAGVIALVQILNNAKPSRDIRLLASLPLLAAYGVLLAMLLLVLALGSWVAAFPNEAVQWLGAGSVDFFAGGRVGLFVMLLSLASLIGFVYFIVRTRWLLDSKLYLQRYILATPPQRVREFIAAIYDEKSAAALHAGELHDPFQPIREYVKDNAFKYYDYGTADGLRQFAHLFGRTLEAVRQAPMPGEYERLGQYVGESALEFFVIFSKTSSEKRKTDTIMYLARQGEALLQEPGGSEAVPPIIRALEGIAQLGQDDEEVIAVIERIQRLCDAYLEKHEDASWKEVAETFEGVCLAVTRISEMYYLQKNNSLKTMPVIGYYTGKHHTVTGALVGFFGSYRDLGDRYENAQPLYYFAAIEGVIEVLFARLGEVVETNQQNVGFNMKYHDLVHELYGIYYGFGLDALEHKKPELLALALSNLRRIIKPAKNFSLATEHATIANMFVELSARGVATFGDIPFKGERTISVYAHETLQKHATAPMLEAAFEAAAAKGVDLKQEAVAKLIDKLRTIQP